MSDPEQQQQQPTEAAPTEEQSADNNNPTTSSPPSLTEPETSSTTMDAPTTTPSSNDDLETILTQFHKVHMESIERIRHLHQKRHQTQSSQRAQVQALLESLASAREHAEQLKLE